MFCKCPKCGFIHEIKKYKQNFCICSACNHYETLPYDMRIDYLVDENTFEELDSEFTFTDPIQFPGYRDKYETSVTKTDMKEAVITGSALIGGVKVMLGIMDSRFMMGSMGIAVGEKITRLFEKAGERNIPVILFSASGGARMQEGVFSLMQMAKTTAALSDFQENGGLFISFLTNPTMGGVSASFALLGDINLAEPEALIGFSGKRVVEQTIKETMPSNFQSSEYLLNCGYLDAIVERKDMRNIIIQLLMFHKAERKRLAEKEVLIKVERFIEMRRMKEEEKRDISAEGENLSPAEKNNVWQKVLLARSMKRFRSLDIIPCIFQSFIELHGDRNLGDDKSIVCGLAWFEGIPVTVISQQKGTNAVDMKYRQYGMTMPEGYRKSLRLMKQAEKFHRPILCLIDTPGAYPGISAEEHGQAEAIGRNLYEMSKLKVPVISILLGEGGSGGALALGVANELLMMENAIFSVISPEGCASILWKDNKLANKVAEALKMTAEDLKSFGLVDYVIPENTSFSAICGNIREAIHNSLAKYYDWKEEDIIENRRNKYRMFDHQFHGIPAGSENMVIDS